MSQSDKTEYRTKADRYLHNIAGEVRKVEIIEAEPLRNYQFLEDDDGDLAIEIPGFYTGEPRVRELHYNGGEHALYIRSDDQFVVCDYIHEDVRALLMGKKDIFVLEPDTKRDYMASIIIDDIDDLANEAVEVHDFRFSHQPYPVMNGSLRPKRITCDCCNRSVLAYFPGEKNICPECIESGETDMFKHIPNHYRVGGDANEIFRTNPPFLDRGKPVRFWGIHCYTLGIYLGELRYDDLIPALKEELISNWESLFGWWNDFEPEEVFNDVGTGRLNAYLFKCPECGKHYVAFNEYEAVSPA